MKKAFFVSLEDILAMNTGWFLILIVIILSVAALLSLPRYTYATTSTVLNPPLPIYTDLLDILDFIQETPVIHNTMRCPPSLQEYGPVLYCYGTPFNDDISGDNTFNLIHALNGDDFVFGRGNTDYILGDEGNDAIDGGDGNDGIYGMQGRDIIDGGSGHDGINANYYYNSTAPDGYKDKIDCGPGYDRVWINSFFDNDDTKNCEEVYTEGIFDGIFEFVDPWPYLYP